jgi:hypothetical protein
MRLCTSPWMAGEAGMHGFSTSRLHPEGASSVDHSLRNVLRHVRPG